MLVDNAIVLATVPLAELFDYSNELRSMTQGAGTFSMTPSGYRLVPERCRSGSFVGAKVLMNLKGSLVKTGEPYFLVLWSESRGWSRQTSDPV